ncbi:PHD finger protein ALFIN-LIKE 8-like isoform X2 [Curcuma longa]|uniref:PHD finger protein ALFIN-LIKE 8-like isoform X2 n=1 Tax=Curcuma longa TaxID=136217 RepID=UPI003D9EC8AA
MDGGGATGVSFSPEDVFRDYSGRRAGMIKALTTEFQKFYHQCDPEKENLCLFGFPNETWEVNLPVENVPPQLPEPALGINFARDSMDEKDWLAIIAIHSDSWLLAVAFFFSSRFGFDKENRLFNMINDLPTIFEVVTGCAKKQVKEKTPSSSNKKNSRSKRSSVAEVRKSLQSMPPCKDDEDDIREGHDNTLCGACGENYCNDGFWICCDICERWFHGKCVEITPARAEHIKLYKCPSCSNNKG